MARTPWAAEGRRRGRSWKADWKEHSSKQGSEDPGLVPALHLLAVEPSASYSTSLLLGFYFLYKTGILLTALLTSLAVVRLIWNKA